MNFLAQTKILVLLVYLFCNCLFIALEVMFKANFISHTTSSSLQKHYITQLSIHVVRAIVLYYTSAGFGRYSLLSVFSDIRWTIRLTKYIMGENRLNQHLWTLSCEDAHNNNMKDPFQRHSCGYEVFLEIVLLNELIHSYSHQVGRKQN